MKTDWRIEALQIAVLLGMFVLIDGVFVHRLAKRSR